MICTPMTSLKTSIKTITYLSDTGCLEIQGASLVVVLNGKINGNACIVVPLSTTRDHDKLNRGMHVEIASNVINGLQFFDQQIRWAKADLVQQVSRNRLNRARTYRGYLNQCLPHELVADIQRAVIKSINTISLIN
ncbi:type II toxin-antitoxin system PemK/MazF family toxin [Shigella sp. FC2531]|uniref:type II toxin-antitoxin system PemK/MazF family toxin n=2 Tax=Enterobacteriaceae TaxID=543 RepID=UPI00209308DE|nr:type II toxin-antitoxin system PemK/MazF family toxin [Shigella sp. FC2531]